MHFAASIPQTLAISIMLGLALFGLVRFFMKQRSDDAVNYSPLEAVAITLLGFFGSQVVAVLLVSLGASVIAPGRDLQQLLEQSAGWQFSYVLLAEAIVVGLLYQFLKRRGTTWSTIGWVQPRLKDIGYAFGGFGIYFLTYVLVIFSIIKHYVPQIDTEQHQDLGFSASAGGVDLVLIFLSLVILPPLTEELLMRGFLFTGLKAKLKLLPAALITSVLFAAAHLQWGNGKPLLWIAAVDTFVLSLVLVGLRHRSGSLWPGIGLHFIKNGIAFLALFIFKVT